MTGPVAPELLALQQAVAGRYSIERELGRGGMGIVFLGRDVALDRPVAIKLLPPQLAAQGALRGRFLREAQMAAKLSHPNVIPIYSVEQVADFVFFVMAYVEGQTLGQRLRERGPLNPAEGVRMIREVAWALAYAHLRGIVHRDIKPDNILIEQDTGRHLVSDFGIARATDTSGGTAVGEVLGTAQYMSPEQACGEKVDGRSDLYSLGGVAYYALSGRLPFDAPEVPALLAMHIAKPAPPLASVAPGVPRQLAQAIDRCLAKKPDQRFETGEQLAVAVAQSTAVARELPAPVRVWLTKGDGARPFLHWWTALLVLATVIEPLTGEGFPFDNLIAIAVPWTVFALHRVYQTQRALAAGYGLDDLRLALRQRMEKRREELVFEYDRDPPVWARVLRKLSFAGLAVAAAGAAYAWLTSIPSVSITAWLMGGGSALAVGGALLGRLFPGKRLRPRDTLFEYRVKLLDGWLGRAFEKLARVGLDQRAVPAAGTHRPTELVIGMAADQLFESLPRETRRELRDLPDVVRRLEAHAQAMRAQVDELGAMLSGGQGDETPASGSSSVAGGGEAVSAALRASQDKLRAEVETRREQAAHQLAAAVAALENVRLGLLRLKAGVGTVDQISADLGAARELQAEIDRAIGAQREIDALLAAPRPAPSPPASPGSGGSAA
jgi:serine/threonine-protein kinase